MDATCRELFFTDKQLCERWRCSHLKLWRLRRAGKLCRPIKIGGTKDKPEFGLDVGRVFNSK